MTASIQWQKEARQMLWPWTVVMGAALLSVLAKEQSTPVMRQISQFLLIGGAFIGVPLLAALPFGFEFEYRTHGMLLSQPVERRKLWLQKQSVALVAALIPAAVYAATQPHRFPREFESGILLLVWMIALMSGAAFWTVVGRSTLAGTTINTAITIVMIIGFEYVDSEFVFNGWDRKPLLQGAAAVFATYCVAMFAAGRAVYLRHQVGGALSTVDLLDWSRNPYVPNFLHDVLRPRKSSPLLNLVRRELHLEKPVFLLASVNFVAWGLLLLLGLVPKDHRDFPIAMIMTVMLSPITAVLAGAISMGEEKTLGTHDWNLTLPIRVGTQWLVKLVVALLTSVICAALIPMACIAFAQWTVGSHVLLGHDALWTWPLTAAVATIFAFWASCMAKSAVRAALWFFPACSSFLMAAELSRWVCDALVTRTRPLIQKIMLTMDPFRMSRLVPSWSIEAVLLTVLLPTVVFAIFLSYRLFRVHAEDKLRYAVRSAFPIFAMSFATSFVVWTCVALGGETFRFQDQVFHETHQAIVKLQASRAKVSGETLQFSAEELQSATLLTEGTRRWLGTGGVTVRSDVQLRKVEDCCGSFFRTERSSLAQPKPYIATFSLKNGWHCQLSYRVTNSEYGTIGANCEP